MEEVLLVLAVLGGLGILACFLVLALARLAGRNPPVPASPPRQRLGACPGCDGRITSWDETCPRCGLELDSALAGWLRELVVARRVVSRLVAHEHLDTETGARLVQTFAAERRRLLGAAAAPVPPARVEQEILEAIPVPDEAPPVRAAAAVRPAGPPPPAPAPLPPAEAVVGPPPRRVTAVLAAFMEERNILWGELVGGLLIVGCSIALVLTLWNSLQELPYFPVLLLGGLTAALFGAGWYTLHHWKLESTSRGLLLVALLLAPLDLLLLADPSARGPTPLPAWLPPIVALAGLVLFSCIVRGAAGHLVGAIERGWLLMLAVAGTAGTQLLTPLFLDGSDAATLPVLLALSALPGLCYLGSTTTVLAGLWRQVRRGSDLAAGQAHALFTFLGLAAFSLVATLAFLVLRTGDAAAYLSALAVPVSLAGVPGLAGGLLVQRRLRPGAAGTRTAGTGVALGGLALLLAGLALAWPEPLPLFVVALLAGVVIALAAVRGRAGFLHATGLPCLALAVLLGAQGALAGWSVPPDAAAAAWLAEQLVSPRSGLVLACFTAAAAAAGLALHQRAGRDQAGPFGLATTALAVLALAIATGHGLERPLAAAIVHGVIALAALAAAWRIGRHSLAQAGAWLLLPAGLWALHAIVPGRPAAWGTALAAQALVLVLAAGALARRPALALALRASGAAAGLLAAGLALAGSFPTHPLHPATAAVLAGVALVLAGQLRQRLLAAGGSLLGLAGLALLFAHQLPPGSLHRPLTAALLVHATLSGLVCWRLASRSNALVDVFLLPLRLTGLAGSMVGFGLVLAPGPDMAWRAGYALWAALLWLAPAWKEKSPGWFALFQAGLSAAAVLATRALVDALGLFGSGLADLDPRLLQLHGLVLGALVLAWAGSRQIEALRPLHPTHWVGLDRLVLFGLVLGQLALTIVLAVPGVAVEWRPGAVLADFPWWRLEAAGLPGWLCLAVLAAAVVATLRQAARRGEGDLQTIALAWLAALAASAAGLWAARYAPERATASALRWGLATVFVAGSALVWLRASLGHRLLASRQAGGSAGVLHALLGVLATLVFLLSAVAAGLALAGVKAGGPAAESIFARLGFTPSHLGPLLLLVIGLAGTALRERSAGYAFVACQLACVSVAGGYLVGLPVVEARHALVACLLVVLTGSSGALLWLAAWRRVPDGLLLTVQAWQGLGLLAATALLPVAALLASPGGGIDPAFSVIGHPGGWLALVLAGTAAFLHARRHEPGWQPTALGLPVLLAGPLAACLALPWDTAGEWLAYHCLGQTWAGLGLIAVVAGSLAGRDRLERVAGGATTAVSVWLAVLGAVLCLAALRGADDPAAPWVACGAALSASLVLAAPVAWFGRGGFAYFSGLALCLVGGLAWLAWGPSSAASFLLVMALCLALAASAWGLPGLGEASRPFARLAGPVALAVSAGAIGLALAADLAGQRTTLPDWLGWLCLAAVGLALVVPNGRAFSRQALYVLSLAALGLALHGLRLPAAQLPWAAGLALALHAGVAGLAAWRLPDEAEREWGWFLPVQMALRGVVVLLVLWACLVPASLAERLTGPLMLALLAAAGWPLAEAAARDGTRRLDWLAPAALAAALAALAWAVPAGHAPLAWLQRDVWLLLVLAATAAGCLQARAAAGSRLLPLRWLGHLLFGLGVLAALVALGQMLPLFDPVSRQTPLDAAGVVAALLGLGLLVATALRLALSERGPGQTAGLGERGRMGFVYLAEVLVVLLFAHVRLNVPWLFIGPLARYWTLIVMGLAFAGVGAAELFERRGLRVLAVPLRRTGVFLPLLPLLAFWARPPAALVDLAGGHAPGLMPFLRYLNNLPLRYDAHALLWFLAGGLYLVLALTRRSPRWALVGAVAANFGLWAVWLHTGIDFLVHPQAWLIPLALIVLAAEHVNRPALSAEVSAGLRYLGVSLIYVASTADLFIAGIGSSLWLPVLLAVLCVAGVLAGIWLRVRAFLFLGVGFLLVDVCTMIWHAAVHRAHTWVWWASGIVLGVAILALFALFEKRRNDVLRLLDELRRWH